VPVSAVDCVQPALQHTRDQLFTHFRWGQWARLAIVGILAAELHVGGCGVGNLKKSLPRVPHQNQMEFLPSSAMRSGLPPFPAHLSEHIAQFIGLFIVGVFAFMLLVLLFLFISSVFRFILFESVLRRQCSIEEGWQKWSSAGRRFFLWQIVFQIAAFLFLAVLVGMPLVLAMAAGSMADLKHHIGRMVLVVILFGGLFGLFVLTAAVVQVLAKDFLVPIMALEDLDFADGWQRLLSIIAVEKGQFALYLLLKLVLSIAAAIIFSILPVIPVLFIAVPSVVAIVAGRAAGMGWNVTTVSLAIIFGSVLLLILIYLIALVCVPTTVFFPAYAMYFLAARYPNLGALINHVPPPTPELPPVIETPPPFEAPPLPPSESPIG